MTLTGGTGIATDALRSLVNGDFSVWNLLANVTAPLWQGGRLREEVTRAEAESAQALAAFANTALTAYAEVETALAAEAILLERERQLAASVEHARARRGWPTSGTSPVSTPISPCSSPSAPRRRPRAS